MAMIVVIQGMPLLHLAYAQTQVIGTTSTEGNGESYSISLRGLAIDIEMLGALSSDSRSGFVLGQFVGNSQREVLRIQRTRSDTVTFSATLSDGAVVSRPVRLSREIGTLLYAVTGFDLSRDGYDDIAIIDASSHHYRWFIIRNPLQADRKELQSFRLGSRGERIEWTTGPEGAIEFAALRHSLNSKRVRLLLRDATNGRIRIFRARLREPKGLLIPIRGRNSEGLSPNLSLFSPLARRLYFFTSRSRLASVQIPQQRCNGYQIVSDASSLEAAQTAEVCSDGSIIVVERQRNTDTVDRKVDQYVLPSPIFDLRRGDQTRVRDGSGELPVLLPATGSTGEVVLDPPARVPVAGPPTAAPQPTASSTPLDSIPSATPTPSVSPTPSPAPRFLPFQSPALLKDINNSTSTNDSGYAKGPHPLANDTIVFTAMNPEFGEELWVTDGTLAGTQVLDSVNPHSSSFPLSELGLNGNASGTLAYYGCFSEQVGRGLCVTDGTVAGTRRIEGAFTSRRNLRACGNGAFATGSFGLHGTSLIYTDGTSPLSLVAPIGALADSTAFSDARFTCGGSLLYFSTTSATYGSELWMSDGTSAGTSLVHDVYAGTNSGYSAPLGSLGRKLLFQGSDATYTAAELWMYDPDATSCDAFDASTSTCTIPTNGLGRIGILKDIFPGTGNAGIASTSAMVVNGKLYFQGINSASNTEIWVTDGTSAGTTLVFDYPGTGVGPSFAAVYNGGTSSRIYFTANRGAASGNYGIEPHMLTVSNPGDCTATYGADFTTTTNGDGCIGMISDMNPSGNSSTSFYGANASGVFFSSSGPPSAYYYWNSTPTIPSIYSSTIPASSGSNALSRGLIFLTFSAAPPPAVGGVRELWFSDGTSAQVLKEINATAGSVGTNNSAVSSARLGENRFFTAWREDLGIELWRTNGTSEGTILVKDINSGAANASPNGFAVLDGVLFFSAQDSTYGRELWAYDPNATDCSRFDPTTTFATSCDTNNPAILPGKIGIVKNINAAANSGSPANISLVGSKLYFMATDSTNGTEPWISNGTASGTVLMHNIRSNGNSTGSTFAQAGNAVVFQASDSSGNNDLYAFISGNEPDTAACAAAHGAAFLKANAAGCYARLFDFTTSSPSITILGSTLDTSKVFFLAGEAVTGVELYVTNGTIAGTYLVKDILPGALSGFNTEHGGTAGAFGDGSFVFTAIDGYLSNGISDQQIWISDGTAAGTYKLSSSSAGYNARALHVDRAANLIFFFAGTPDTGMELWRSAGTVSTTQLVKDLCPGSCSGAASGHELGTILSIMSLEDGQIMFRGSNGASGGEPVVSDGTPQGTYLIDLVAGSGGSSPLLFGSLSAGRAFIYANNNTHGHEPWVVSTQ